MALSSMTVTQLREEMAKYGLAEPKGTGDKGKVLKPDLLNHIKEYEAANGIVRKGARKTADKPEGEKAPSRSKSPTTGLKAGDHVRYFEEGKYDFEAIVTGRISSLKVKITPIVDIDATYNSKTEADVVRKNLTIVGTAENGAVDANTVKLTIKSEAKTIVLTVQEVDIDQLTKAFTDMLDASDIKYNQK